MGSRVKSWAVFSRRRWRHLYDNCRIKIASKHRNCGDIRNSFWFFVIKNEGQTQKASGSKVADWQDVGVEKCTPWLVSNWDRTGRNWSNFEDRFVETDFGDSPPIDSKCYAVNSNIFPFWTESIKGISICYLVTSTFLWSRDYFNFLVITWLFQVSCVITWLFPWVFWL